ncbi:helix-turn-helix domain-containing protein [Melittangium boletus]|uniref:Transcriptional regulator n=1 Tax=Melittangium boletus DSM 14713 TaxID=1294270 RepID=A0A250IG92_9BACT|nr:helix-turn-helix transcriptional regulator [Melittangium boletus]ATB30839.1 transcriptional regulator [Melittangium boletus DSM 14713]
MDDIDSLKRSIGAALLMARERAGLTQADVSSMSGLASAMYGRIERGQMLPSVPTLHRLCMALRISASALLGLSSPRDLAAAAPEPPMSPQLARLARLLRMLSPGELRCLGALALDIRRRKNLVPAPSD